MAKNYNIDDIEKYLEGQLSDEATEQFQQDMDTDAQLTEEVIFHEDIIKGIKSGAEQDFGQELWENLGQCDH